MFVPLTPLDYKRRAVRNFGDKIGVIDGERRFTYREFGERADRLAGALRALDVAAGDRVAFITYNTHHLLEAYYGVLQAGCVLTPINIRLSADEIAYVLEHSGAAVLVYHRDFQDLVDRVRPRAPRLRHLVILEGEDPEAHAYETLLARASPEPGPEISAVDENAICELFYTSGTTGRPKGVALTHRSLALHALYFSVTMRMSDADRVLHVVPLFHVNGWGTPQVLTAVGGTHVMLRKVVAQDILRLVERERITVLLGVPSIYTMLVNEPTIGTFDLTSLRRAVSGGAPASPSLIRAMEEKLGCLCVVGYGLTETAPLLSKALPKAHLGGTADDDLRRRSTTGFEIVGVDMRVVDGDPGQRDGVTERDQFPRPLGRGDGGHLGDLQDVALARRPLGDEPERGGLHHDLAPGHGLPHGLALAADIHHPRAAVPVQVGQQPAGVPWAARGARPGARAARGGFPPPISGHASRTRASRAPAVRAS